MRPRTCKDALSPPRCAPTRTRGGEGGGGGGGETATETEWHRHPPQPPSGSRKTNRTEQPRVARCSRRDAEQQRKWQRGEGSGEEKRREPDAATWRYGKGEATVECASCALLLFYYEDPPRSVRARVRGLCRLRGGPPPASTAPPRTPPACLPLPLPLTRPSCITRP